MLTAFVRAFKTPDLRKKLLFTLFIMAIFRLGSHVPTPGVSYVAVRDCQANGGGGAQLLGLADLFSGGALLQLSIFALGIMPVSYTHLDVYKRQGLREVDQSAEGARRPGRGDHLHVLRPVDRPPGGGQGCGRGSPRLRLVSRKEKRTCPESDDFRSPFRPASM